MRTRLVFQMAIVLTTATGSALAQEQAAELLWELPPNQQAWRSSWSQSHCNRPGNSGGHQCHGPTAISELSSASNIWPD